MSGERCSFRFPCIECSLEIWLWVCFVSRCKHLSCICVFADGVEDEAVQVLVDRVLLRVEVSPMDHVTMDALVRKSCQKMFALGVVSLFQSQQKTCAQLMHGCKAH